MEELVSLANVEASFFNPATSTAACKGVYDYGPLGVELKNNLKAAWWRAMVYERDDIEGLDAAILTNPMTLRHSGHEATFTDPMVDCRALQKQVASRSSGRRCLPGLRIHRSHGTQTV
jgi:glycyl-tRNA synthetase